MLKKQIRILGIDDAPFIRYRKGNVLVIGAFFRGGDFLDGVISTYIKQDGFNSTKKLANMINKSKFKPQLQAVLLDGIALGGFNVVDIENLSCRIKLPVVVVIRNMPDFKKIEKALEKVDKSGRKLRLIKKAGEVAKVDKIYVQFKGCSIEFVKEVLKIACTHSFIPEPVRAAHLIGQGVVKGESKGRV